MPERRPTQWFDVLFNETIIAGAQINTDLVEQALDQPRSRLTVTRTIIDLTVVTQLLNTSEGAMRIRWGIGVASREAFEIVGGLPDVDDANEYPALGWIGLGTGMTFSSTDQLQVYRVQEDIRASRKIDRGVLFMTIDNSAFLGASHTVQVIGRVRALCYR